MTEGSQVDILNLSLSSAQHASTTGAPIESVHLFGIGRICAPDYLLWPLSRDICVWSRRPTSMLMLSVADCLAEVNQLPQIDTVQVHPSTLRVVLMA